MSDEMSIRDFLSKFDAGEFSSSDRGTQCAAGWFDWFCKDFTLRDKTYRLTAKLKSIVKSPKINKDTMYVFFKNNCPMSGPLYDDFRICYMGTEDIIWTVTPKGREGKAELWGRENNFNGPIVQGEWADVKQYFFSSEGKEVNEMKASYGASYGRSSREKVISAWPFLSSAGTTTYETQLHQDGILTCNCFTGDTKIPLLNGKILSLKEIQENFGSEEFWVFSSNDKGDFVPAKAKCLGVTGIVDKLVKITLDNDKEITCTLDHPFRLRDGNYKKAKDLEIGVSLLPLSMRLSKKSKFFSRRYFQVRINSKNDSWNRPIYKMVHRVVKEALEGTIPKGITTHHKNFDTWDNTPENLRNMTVPEHMSLHAKIGFDFKTFWKVKKETDPKFMKKVQKKNRKAGKISQQKRPDCAISRNQKGIDFCKSIGGRVFLSCWAKSRKRDIFGRFLPGKLNNHKVKKIEVLMLEDPVQVYDLYVDKYRNFALDAGIYVHNCPGWVRHVKNGMRECKHVREILPKAEQIMSGGRKPEFVSATVQYKVVEVQVPKKEYVEIRSSRRLLRAIPIED